MAKFEILRYPDPLLSRKAKPVERVDDEVRTLIGDMVETMFGADGVGVAATQLGVDMRVIVLDVPTSEADDGQPVRGRNVMGLVNPEIVSSSGEISYEEGCLSVPGVLAYVTRASNVVVKALDADGKEIEIIGQGLLAVALQHEIDHIDGVLFIDRLSRLKREFITKKLKKLALQTL